jgi:hypothetical protein
MSDWRGYIILGIGVAVPILLLAFRRERELLLWICLTIGISVLDARVGINLPAARIVGLLVLPYLALGAFRVTELSRTTPFQLLLAHFAYLLLLGVIFGFIFPWPEDGFIRTYFQTAPGRTIVYVVRMVADLGLILFVARQVMRGLRASTLVRMILIGTTVAAVAGLVEFATKVQLYELLTGYPIQQIANRIRGLNFEPRGLGLAVAHGLFFGSLLYMSRRGARLAWLLALHAVVLALTVSASALLAALAMWIALFIVEPKGRRLSLLGGGAAAVGVAALAVYGAALAVTQSWSINLIQRFSVEQIRAAAAESSFESMVMFLDIFDLTAVLALRANPAAAAVGAGPGLVTLPASHFIPQDVIRWSWVGASGEGITSLPSMGLLLEWANGGVVAVVLWFALVISLWRACSRLERLRVSEAPEWRLARNCIAVAAAGYLMQASPLAATWAVIVGFGIGAAWLSARAAAPVEKSLDSPAVVVGRGDAPPPLPA